MEDIIIIIIITTTTTTTTTITLGNTHFGASNVRPVSGYI